MEGSSSNGIDPSPHNSVEMTTHEVQTSTSIPEGSTVPTNSTTDVPRNNPTTPSVENEENTLYEGTGMESNASIVPLENALSAFVVGYVYPLCLLCKYDPEEESTSSRKSSFVSSSFLSNHNDENFSQSTFANSAQLSPLTVLTINSVVDQLEMLHIVNKCPYFNSMGTDADYLSASDVSIDPVGQDSSNKNSDAAFGSSMIGGGPSATVREGRACVRSKETDNFPSVQPT
eukprot:6098458-Ditylum_brightwellii.AAC.1